MFRKIYGFDAKDAMDSQSMIFFWTVVIPLFLTVHCLVPVGRERGFDLCVTSRQGIKDLSNQTLSRVPPHLPKITEYLDISYNNIAEIDDRSLVGLTKLCFLKATHCGLRFISPNAFVQTSGIKVLNVSQNSLSIIPDLSLPQLRILDLTSNLYDSYQLPSTFQKLTHLELLFLGSGKASLVKSTDFTALRNISVKQFGLSARTGWQSYESGSLTNLRSLQEMTLNVPFCEKFDIFKNFLMDLNRTQTTILRLVKLFPDNCTVADDPFETLKSMDLVKNLTLVDTWVNSSVMVKLLKNAWVSNIQQLGFFNITYNEDTPDGLNFFGQNYSVHLRSVIFDHVAHYQYKYPSFNISVEALSQMTYLKLSGTGMNISPCNLISALPSLETLDLSNNLLDESGFWWTFCSYTSVFPALKHLSLSQNRFLSLSIISEKTHQMRSLQSLDLSFNSISIGGRCSWPRHLRELNLSNNNLGNTVFRFLSPHFEWIDLSKTGITAIDQKVLLEFPSLTHLFLSSNSIQVLPVDLHAPLLHTLYIDQNIIATIYMGTFEGLPRLRTIKAGNNPFSCSCDSYWFVTALNKSLLPDWPLDYTCSVPPILAGMPLADYKPGKLSCELWLQAAIALSITFVITTALGFTFYACDGVWYTKMLWVWILVKRRGKKKTDKLRDVSFHYHAFISYSQYDSSWVESMLVSTLERAGLSLCIHERDFVPGEWIIDNIINCAEASYKTIFVLSNNFVQSDWCNYELFFAQHRAVRYGIIHSLIATDCVSVSEIMCPFVPLVSIQEDSLVFLLLEPIPPDSLPKKFLNLRGVLRQQTYLQWPGAGAGEEMKRQVFWSSLKAMLRVADRSMVNGARRAGSPKRLRHS
ncbi:toll-like receptor 1 isoform X3 [Esox lucius]|uniref:toll-like receptor 1 isoform X3 n=1 Tax=Esox lucius TaxID=8010 RepID=UPI001476A407|nr:toll-like receptor 1 isoform X3 [Esox lucius]